MVFWPGLFTLFHFEFSIFQAMHYLSCFKRFTVSNDFQTASSEFSLFHSWSCLRGPSNITHSIAHCKCTYTLKTILNTAIQDLLEAWSGYPHRHVAQRSRDISNPMALQGPRGYAGRRDKGNKRARDAPSERVPPRDTNVTLKSDVFMLWCFFFEEFTGKLRPRL